MAHSIELLLDGPGDEAIRQIWHALDDVGLPSAAAIRAATNRPHITLLAARQIDPSVDKELVGLAGELPIPCVIGSPLVFGAGRFTLTRMIVPSAHLLEVQAEVHRRCLPYVSGEPFAHSAPGQWAPHTTLGRRFTPVQVGQALGVIEATAPDITAQVAGLRRWDGDQREEHLLIG